MGRFLRCLTKKLTVCGVFRWFECVLIGVLDHGGIACWFLCSNSNCLLLFSMVCSEFFIGGLIGVTENYKLCSTCGLCKIYLHSKNLFRRYFHMLLLITCAYNIN